MLDNQDIPPRFGMPSPAISRAHHRLLTYRFFTCPARTEAGSQSVFLPIPSWQHQETEMDNPASYVHRPVMIGLTEFEIQIDVERGVAKPGPGEGGRTSEGG